MAHWHGPLPPPDALRSFNEIIPNGADRIVSQWEQETEHRRRFEQKALSSQIFERIASRVMALVFSLTALGGAIYLGIIGHDWLAGTIGTTTIGVVISAYVLSSHTPKK